MKRIMMAFLFIISCRLFCGCGEITSESKQQMDSSLADTGPVGTGGQIISNAGTGGTIVVDSGVVDSGMINCIATVPINGSCSENCVCLSGSCTSGYCSVSLKNNGDPCNRDKECVSVWCHPDLGICRDKPELRQPGEDCVSDWQCNGFCSTSTVPNTCHVTLRSGGACTRNTQCNSIVCDTGRNQCE